MSNEWGTTVGRRFKVCTGRVSQSVNICYQGKGVDGSYEYRFKMQGGKPLTAFEIELASHESVEQLNAFLLSYGFTDLSGQLTTKQTWQPTLPDVDWGTSIRTQIDQAVEHLTDSFLRQPYRHRVEHSLHCELFRLLSDIPAIRDGRIKIAGDHASGLVHKEWPETVIREEKTGRGNFDLAVLTPTAGIVEQARFLKGYVKPYAAFELGLDYDRDHFLSDVKKLRHSRIDAGYVIHFARGHALDQDMVIECLAALKADGRLGTDGWPRVVVVILDESGGPRHQHRLS